MNAPPSVVLGVFGVVEFALLITTIVYMSRLVGDKDDSNELSKSVTIIVSLMCLIVAIHTAMWYVYLIYNSLSLNLYLIITTSLCLILSLASMGLSITNRA